MNYTGHETAGQYGLVTNQLTKMRMGRQRNVAALYLLRQIGIELSEPMLFGLGEGLGFIFWNMKSMNFPFIGG